MKYKLRWLSMLNKRLYKKVSFVIILLLIPLCVFLFSIAAEEDSGFLHIVLAQTNPQDEVSSAVIDNLLCEDTVVRFSKAESPQEATELVKTGQADEAWIFPENTADDLAKFASAGKDKFITIVCREQTIFTRLTHEKLSCSLYEYCAKAYYLDFTRENLPELDLLSDAQLIEYYENVSIDEELFVFDNPTSTAENDKGNTNYLTTPIRGLLAVIATLCGMAAAMYYMQDEALGTFSHIPQASRIYIAFECLMIATVNVSAAIFISLFAADLATNLFREMVILILFSVCCAVFSLFLNILVPSQKLYGTLIPLLTVIMLVVCPIFFDIKGVGIVQLIFPATYFVNASYSNVHLMYMGLYAVIGCILCIALHNIKRLKFRKHK